MYLSDFKAANCGFEKMVVRKCMTSALFVGCGIYQFNIFLPGRAAIK